LHGCSYEAGSPAAAAGSTERFQQYISFWTRADQHGSAEQAEAGTERIEAAIEIDGISVRAHNNC
jgi:head-tail adaptor